MTRHKDFCTKMLTAAKGYEAEIKTISELPDRSNDDIYFEEAEYKFIGAIYMLFGHYKVKDEK